MEDKYVSKLSPTADFWAGIYLVVIAMLSILGNALVLISVARRHSQLKAPELLTVNLAITDLGMAISMYPLSIASAFSHTWVGGDVSCLYYGLMGMIFSITSIMTISLLGVVRYLVTGSPPKRGITFHRRSVCLVIIVIWLYSGVWALLPLLGWGSYGPEPFGIACSIDWASYGESLNNSTFIMSLSVLCTFLPCLVIVFTYFGIAWKLHKAYQSNQNQDFQYGNIEKRITLMAVLISAGFIFAWTPYVAVSFWNMFHSQQEEHVAPLISLLPCLFAKSSTTYNPFLYFILRPRSRKNLPNSKRLEFCRSCLPGSPAGEPETKVKITNRAERSVLTVDSICHKAIVPLPD